MKKKSKPPSIEESWKIPAAARECGCGKTTLVNAIKKGNLQSWMSGCGQEFVRIEDVKAYLENPPEPGYWSHKANKVKRKPK